MELGMKVKYPLARLLKLGLAVGISSTLFIAAIELYRRSRQYKLTLEQWTKFRVNSNSAEFQELLRQISQRGVAPEARNTVWPYLLELFKPEWSLSVCEEEVQKLQRDYKLLLDRCEELDFEHKEAIGRNWPGQHNHRHSADEDENSAHTFFAQAQRTILLDTIRTRFPAIRSSGAKWPAEPPEVRESITDGLRNATHLKGGHRAAAIQLVNLLCSYAVHDQEIGYCQGMSDLAVPFLVAIDDESMAFWAFSKMMRTARSNFLHDSSGIREHLSELAQVLQRLDPELMQRLRQLQCSECHFAYRMLLVRFRRELDLSQAMLLWEMLWSEHLLRSRQKSLIKNRSAQSLKPYEPVREVPCMLTFVAAAAIIRQRKQVLKTCKSSDDVMALFINQKVRLSGVLSLAKTLRR